VALLIVEILDNYFKDISYSESKNLLGSYKAIEFVSKAEVYVVAPIKLPNYIG
jgi:hypothetical protein